MDHSRLIFDVAKAREPYVGSIGFAVDWDLRFDELSPPRRDPA